MGPIIIFGLCGNLMSFTVLLRKKMRSEAFNQMLASLCVIDTIFLLCNPLSSLHALGINSRKYLFHCIKVFYLFKSFKQKRLSTLFGTLTICICDQ